MCLYGTLLLWIVSILHSSPASKSKEVCITLHHGKFFPYVQVTRLLHFNQCFISSDELSRLNKDPLYLLSLVNHMVSDMEIVLNLISLEGLTPFGTNS